MVDNQSNNKDVMDRYTENEIKFWKGICILLMLQQKKHNY